MTDIEGSTGLWDADELLAAAAIRDHDHLVRLSVRSNGGYVFATGGDSFAVAFADPSAAADCAIEIREVVAAIGPVRVSVRQALNTGVAVERDGGYYGRPLNRCARLLGCISGGMIAVSETTAALLASADSNHEIVTLGIRDLRGLTRAGTSECHHRWALTDR